MQTQTFSISGISCGSCVAKIESAFQGIGMFQSIEVLRNPDRIKVKSENGITGADLNQVFENKDLAKYRATDFSQQTSLVEDEDSLFKKLFPLALVISYLLLGVFAVAWATSIFSLSTMMFHYMAGFFLVFSFFKFLNIEGFADAFQTYDPLAKAWRPYGYFYAVFELGAGIGYLVQPTSLLLNLVVLILLSISSWGVIKAVRSKNQIQCACLGTVFNLPMTKVTLTENSVMIAMAVVMLIALT